MTEEPELSPSVLFSVEIVDEQNLDMELDRQIRELLCVCFPDWAYIFEKQRIWHSTPPIFSILVKEQNRVIGHLAVVVRTITTTWNFRYNVASIQGVCVDSENRNTGVGHQLLRAALDEAASRGFLFAILYCREFLVPFYTAQGWKLADDSVVMWNQRDLPIAMRSNCPMYYELSDVPFPEGPLDMHSPSWE
jgi:GNAT superfamily N-acetyltransferase